MDVVGDSQEAAFLMAELAAGMASEPQQEDLPLLQSDRGGEEQEAEPAGAPMQVDGEQGDPQRPAAGRGGASPPAAAAVAATQPAARSFAALCAQKGAEAHPQFLSSLNALSGEAFAPLTEFRGPGRGERRVPLGGLADCQPHCRLHSLLGARPKRPATLKPSCMLQVGR